MATLEGRHRTHPPGRPFSSREALDWGLINAIADDGQALPAALELAGQIARHPRVAVAAALVAVRRGTDLPIDQGLQAEEAALREVAGHPDAVEGIRAFLDKRPPAYASH